MEKNKTFIRLHSGPRVNNTQRPVLLLLFSLEGEVAKPHALALAPPSGGDIRGTGDVDCGVRAAPGPQV